MTFVGRNVPILVNVSIKEANLNRFVFSIEVGYRKMNLDVPLYETVFVVGGALAELIYNSKKIKIKQKFVRKCFSLKFVDFLKFLRFFRLDRPSKSEGIAPNILENR